jgi:ATP-dependent helicase HepA
LGIGRVTAVEGRTLVVDFPRSRTRLRLAAGTDALIPVDLDPGRPVRIMETGEETTVARRLGDGRIVLANSRTLRADELWPLQVERSLLERLASGHVDDAADFLVRLDALRLLSLRQAGGLASFLGGRVRLFPHQLYVAERATASDPVRWLLADEVGLGKTIEAALILNRLVHAGLIERCLIVAPESLTVQWLGELWRKYHQVFTLLDEKRLADVARDFGPDFNPFDVHRRAVIALETLVARPHLTNLAVAAGIDLLVVDEAQRLRRPPGHPGEPAWRAIAPLADLRRHVLLLSATPLEDDAHGFFRLLQLLRPEEFPEEIPFEDRLAAGVPLPACTSSTRRVDIGGLPPRVGIPIDIDDPAAWQERDEAERLLRAAPARHAVARRNKAEWIRRALASGAALANALARESGAASARPSRSRTGDASPRDAGDVRRTDETSSPDPLASGDGLGDVRRLAGTMDARDPRVRWLAAEAPTWRDAREKTLVFVAHRETLEMLRTALSHRAQLATGVFHEELSTARRDTEVARFREPDGPSLLVATEAGGEGRNFEFCRRLVLFDLPWNPSVVEQRIGRLDRIGRRIPVEIVYFRPPRGIGADVVRLFEALGVFSEPLAGLEPQLGHVEESIERLALDPDGAMTDDLLDRLVADARAARTRIQEAAYRELHRDPYRAEMAERILARVPAELDALMERVIVTASARLGFTVDRLRGQRRFAIEFGAEALVDSLPGVPGGSSYVGSFDREEAVADETIDFFSSGHPLVEGVLAHIDDSPDGRVAYLEATIGRDRGEGLLVIYRDGSGTEVVVLDSSGRIRPDWAAAFDARPLPVRRMRDDTLERTDWPRLVADLGRRVDRARRPYAVAVVAVRPE